jgi:CDP-6-deoxy-D-xylo-4-hexulose-3-dehydrase
MKISYGKNVYGQEELNAVQRQLKKTTQMSASVKKFENKIATLFEKKFGLMVNSGSSALILAMDILKIKKGDEIITPALNFGTAVSAIVKAGANPIFVDINVNTLQVLEDEIEKKITKKTKAILIPNLIGNIPDWPKLKKISKRYNIPLVEDSADTLGAKIKNKSTGFYSDISITSFYGSHIISCAGNGGILMLNNKNFYNRSKVLRSWGRMSSLLKDSENINKRLKIKLLGVEYDMKFIFSESGYNFEPSEIGAAFGLEQLKKFKRFSRIRNKNFRSHINFFLNYKKYFLIPEIRNDVETNFLAYPIILKENKNFDRKKLQIFLEKKGIQTRPIFSGNILRHPAFRNLITGRNRLINFKNSDYIMKNGILIGCHQGLKKKHINYIHNSILSFLGKKINIKQ